MKLTEYTLKNKKFPGKYVFALVSDLHGNNPTKALEILRGLSPDIILAPGDIFEPLNGEHKAKNEGIFRTKTIQTTAGIPKCGELFQASPGGFCGTPY